MFRRRKWVAAAGAAVLLFAACSSSDDDDASAGTRGGTTDRLGLVVGAPMTSPDFVGRIDQSATTGLLNNVNEALTQLHYDSDGNLEWEPLLAESWERIAPLQWRFHLRQGVVFQSGKPLTAADVVYSINKTLADGAESSGTAFAANLDRAELVDEYIVDMFTQAPDDFVFRSMYRIGVQPEGWGEANPHEAARTADGTGPYRLLEFSTSGDRMVLERWPDYWGDNESIIDEIEIRVVPETGARLAALQAGEADVAIGLSPELLSAAPAQRTTPGIEVEILRIDTNTPPLDNVDVRRALNMAVDRQLIIDGLYSGFARPSNGQTIPPAAFGYNEQLEDYEYDPDGARQLLEQNGAAGATLSMSCTSELNGQVIDDLCNTVAQMLRDVGLEVNVDMATSQKWIDEGLFAPENGLTPPSLAWARAGSDTLHAGQTMLTWFECGGPRSTFCNPEIEQKIQAAAEFSDLGEQEAAWQEVQRLVREQAPVIWLVTLDAAVGAAANADGPVYPSIADGDFYFKEWSIR